MTSSLAAALAASKKDAAKPTDTKDMQSITSSRPSSLMKHTQIHAVATKANNTACMEGTSSSTASKHNRDQKQGSVDTTSTRKNNKSNSESTALVGDNGDRGTNPIPPQREKKNINKSVGKVVTNAASTPQPSELKSDNGTGGVVFVCDIPSDSDDEIADNCNEELGNINDGGPEHGTDRIKKSKKRGGRKKNERSKVDAPDADIIVAPHTSEVVFLCDIPSDDSDTEDNKKKNHLDRRSTRREEDTRYRGKGRGDKDVATLKISDRHYDSRNTTGVTSGTGNINAASPTKGDGRSRDRNTANPLPTSSTGLMPTPWSIRAQTMKQVGTQHHNTTQDIRHNNNRPDTNPERNSRYRCTTQEWRSPARNHASHPSPSSNGASMRTQTNYSNEKAAAEIPSKEMEPTVLKGRWADESDSDE